MEQVDGIRLREFRQVKKEIRGSDQYLIVGIDVAKERHNAFFGTANGKTLHKGVIFDNTIEGFEKLLTLTEALKVQHNFTKAVFVLSPQLITISLWESISLSAGIWLFCYRGRQ